MAFRILIVDDEFGLADVIGEMLSESGYDVELAINGRVGLLRLAEKPADLVLLDVMMPVLDGPGMLAAMRADARLAAIPVVMMTALPEALPASDGYQAILRKPFSPELLFSTIKRLLGE